MHKAIEKCENYKAAIIAKAIEKAKAEYKEADNCYKDTGYDRYFHKMERHEKDIDELEEYAKGNEAILEARREKEKVRYELDEIKKTLKNKLFYLLAVVPDCSEARSLKDYCDRL